MGYGGWGGLKAVDCRLQGGSTSVLCSSVRGSGLGEGNRSGKNPLVGGQFRFKLKLK